MEAGGGPLLSTLVLRFAIGTKGHHGNSGFKDEEEKIPFKGG